MRRENYSIGQRIKKLRIEKGYDREFVSSKTGISKTYIYHIEEGNVSIRVDKLAILCEFLKVSAEYILFGDFYERIKPKIDKLNDEEMQKFEEFLTNLEKEEQNG